MLEGIWGSFGGVWDLFEKILRQTRFVILSQRRRIWPENGRIFKHSAQILHSA